MQFTLIFCFLRFAALIVYFNAALNIKCEWLRHFARNVIKFLSLCVCMLMAGRQALSMFTSRKSVIVCIVTNLIFAFEFDAEIIRIRHNSNIFKTNFDPICMECFIQISSLIGVSFRAICYKTSENHHRTLRQQLRIVLWILSKTTSRSFHSSDCIKLTHKKFPKFHSSALKLRHKFGKHEKYPKWAPPKKKWWW